MNRGRGRIRPPRRGLVTDHVDFDDTWGILSQSLKQIYSKDASALSFEALYRNAYKLVLKKFGERLYAEVKMLVEEHLKGVASVRVRPLVPSVMVTGNTALGNTAAIERRLGGTRFLEGLQGVWQDHQLCMGMITDVLMYLNRIYCLDRGLPTTYAVGMDLFREQILRHKTYNIGRALNTVILSQIKMERDGDIIDHGPIRSCVHMLESLYETLEEREDEKVYLTSFEGEFIDASKEFYLKEGQRLLQECDAATYLRKTETRLAQERDRCTKSISTLTLHKIEKVVDEFLIEKNIRAVMEMDSGIRFMLDNDKIDDLKLMYMLILRVDPDAKIMKEMVSARIVEQGKDVNSNLQNAPAEAASTAPGVPSTSAAAAAAKDEKAASSATAMAIRWVNEILMLKDKYDKIWESAFHKDKSMQTTITRAFTKFINELSVAPEYISLFIDDNLRQGIKGIDETDVDVILDKAVTLFRYLSDKDIFERHYKTHLSRRLLMNRSLSHDAERQMIGKLKMEVGVQFTSKLEGMFKDMDSSNELTTEYRQGPGADNKIDFSIHVLTTTYWPTKVVGQEDKTCTYPTEIEALRESFSAYYLKRHNGRKLIFKPNMGTADLKATFSGKKHEINVSTYGMVILLAFNSLPQGSSLSFSELQTITSIPTDDLRRNLQSLYIPAKTRLLLKTPKSKGIDPADRFCINDSFSSKYLRFKVGIIAVNKAETEKEKKNTDEEVERDRGIQIEACVVRVMKSRKKLNHQELMMEVVNQLKSRFTPDIASVKKRIEMLIEREYLERVEGDRETYKYLA
ncbi:Cullin-domain-containing protein [Ascodesmis nigricans]|uniref:Cullin-domain-containing protein n=1 Tax=Ascodesmis nigricans TaxID=341454 RepID=A0A4S2MNE1_9PEZI|nr:Cullin-domain-containing protein [Ascodesmis nigricans]